MRTQMPMMSACSVYARCKAAVTAGLTTSSAVSAQPATCNPTNLLAAICLLDDGMAGLAARGVVVLVGGRAARLDADAQDRRKNIVCHGAGE